MFLAEFRSRFPFRRLFPAACLILALSPDIHAQRGWMSARPYPTSNPIPFLAWSGSRLVAVSRQGTLHTSPDGIRWETQGLEKRPWLQGVVWSGNRFLVWDYDGKFRTSADGLAWTAANGPIWHPKHVAWTGKAYLGVGSIRTLQGSSWKNEGVIMGSPDGLLWSRQSPVLPDSLRRPTYDRILPLEGSTVILADSGYGFTLGDGLEFGQSIKGLPRHRGVDDLIQGGGRYMALISGYGWAKSTDGLQWSVALEVPSSTAAVWGGDRFVAVGHPSFTNLDTTFSAVSSDGAAWTQHRTRNLEGVQAIAWTGALFVATGNAGRVATSPDGKEWTLRSDTGPYPDLNRVVFHGSRFIAVGNQGVILSSDQGSEWKAENSGTLLNLRCLASHAGRLVAGGDSGILLTSEDGKSWTRRETGLETVPITGLAWCGTQWVATAITRVLTSPDGVQWTPNPLNQGGLSGLEGQLVWTGKRIVSLGLLGRTFASEDGLRWQEVAYREVGGYIRPFYLKCLAWSGTRFTALGDSGIVYASADGLEWQAEPRRDTVETPWLYPVRVGSLWVSASGYDYEKPLRSPKAAAIRTSQDGVSWSHQILWEAAPLRSLASNGTVLVAVGMSGTVLTAIVDPQLGIRPRSIRAPGNGFTRGRRGVWLSGPEADPLGNWKATFYSWTGRESQSDGYRPGE